MPDVSLNSNNPLVSEVPVPSDIQSTRFVDASTLKVLPGSKMKSMRTLPCGPRVRESWGASSKAPMSHPEPIGLKIPR